VESILKISMHSALAGAAFLILAGTPASAGDSANALDTLDDATPAPAAAVAPILPTQPVQFVTGRSRHLAH
jgi:hypothetical protein